MMDATGDTDRDPSARLAAALPKLRAFAISLSRDVVLADDLVQETLLKAWSHFDTFDPRSNLDAWLFTILRNTFYSGLRRSNREVSDPDGIAASTLSVEPRHEATLAYQDFQDAFDRLSPEHREVLVLVGVSGFTCEEVAETLGVAVGTVKSRASRARQQLARLLHLEEGEGAW